MNKLNNKQDSQRSRRGYSLKYRLIPIEEKELKKLNAKAKEKKTRLRRYKDELKNIELGLKKEINEHSFIDSLKCPTGRPVHNLPKSWRVNKK